MTHTTQIHTRGFGRTALHEVGAMPNHISEEETAPFAEAEKAPLQTNWL